MSGLDMSPPPCIVYFTPDPALLQVTPARENDRCSHKKQPPPGITPRARGKAEHAGVVIQFLLQPGEEFCSDCLHGLTGNTHAEEWVS